LSGGDPVLVCDSAEDLSSVDPVFGELDRLRWLGGGLVRRELAEVYQEVAGCLLSRRRRGWR
jgi:hypothetical protein